MRHFDVQILGGVVLHKGNIAEMKTGEGKTLVATLPLYLNGLAGKGAHLITVNDYLAKRDAQWMGAIYHSLGLTVGILQHDTAYLYDPTANRDDVSMRYLVPVHAPRGLRRDITYGTNNEFGFDYLRDNMVTDLERAVQRARHRRTPTRSSTRWTASSSTRRGRRSSSAARRRRRRRSTGRSPASSRAWTRTATSSIDLKHRSVSLTEEGDDKVEQALGIKNLYDPKNFRLTRFLDAALKAQFIYERDKQYVVKDGEVIIVDEFTGRLMDGRRWSDGLHQAVEAKEGVKIQRESVTYATITLQNYFRLYEKLAGMTGTAWTEREEFHQIYGLDVIMVPTHRDMIRQDMQDIIYRTRDGKWSAVVEEIEDAHADGRPILVGTVAIETSEMLADLLKRTSTCRLEDCGEYHRVCPLKEPDVLNAKQHEREGNIVAPAGVLGAVTIATNMAGRGTDIILGGNPEQHGRRDGPQARHRPDQRRRRKSPRRSARKRATMWQDDHDRVVEVGGLHIVGTERHESRRIDNQLRGRAGRQGDPGSSRFFVSFGDDLMKRFSPEWVPNLLGTHGHGREDAAGERHGLEGDRAGADEGGGPQLRHPQARRPVRRRDEPAPRRHLQAAPPDPAAAPTCKDEHRRDGREGDRARRSTPSPPRTDAGRMGHRQPARRAEGDHAAARPAGRRSIFERRWHDDDSALEAVLEHAHEAVREEGSGARRGADAHAGAAGAAARHRPALGVPPDGARRAAAGHRAAGLRPARPAGGVQARGVRHVRAS